MGCKLLAAPRYNAYMQSAIDQAFSAAATAEATYTAGQDNVATIEAAIASATAPLADAQAKVLNGAIAYRAALVALAAEIQTTIATLTEPPSPAPTA